MQRGKTFGHDVDDALRVVCETLDPICAERATPSLVWMAKQLAAMPILCSVSYLRAGWRVLPDLTKGVESLGSTSGALCQGGRQVEAACLQEVAGDGLGSDPQKASLLSRVHQARICQWH